MLLGNPEVDVYLLHLKRGCIDLKIIELRNKNMRYPTAEPIIYHLDEGLKRNKVVYFVMHR